MFWDKEPPPWGGSTVSEGLNPGQRFNGRGGYLAEDRDVALLLKGDGFSDLSLRRGGAEFRERRT